MKDMLRYLIVGGVFALPFLPLIVTNSLFFPYITGKNFIFRIIVEVIFFAWVALALYEPRYRPRFSYILAALVAWLGVVFCADVFGLSPEKSLWSNFERMEGFVAIAHVVLYVLVAGHVLTTEKLWNHFFNTSLGAASLVVLYAFAQLGGAITINQGGDRVDATLGNAAYFAIYMLFHTFIALFMLVRSRTQGMRITYGILVVVFAGMLFQTATRGTILGLAVGGLVTALYLALFSEGMGRLRTWSIGVFVGLLILIGAFVSVRNAEFVKESPLLNRVANISLKAGEARFIIWDLAFEGFKERPLLGWGQENFNYVFNQNYDARLSGEEPWFDRVHDIFFDWLIAAGILGLVSYFAIYFSALYYVFVWPRLRRVKESGQTTFTITEQAVLIGLLAGYMFHNIFVFDNIISYLFYATILAFIHFRVSSEVVRVAKARVAPQIVDNIVLPVCGVMFALTFYFVNVPGLRAASDIIDAFRALPQSPASADYERSLAAFETALSRDSFAEQEIREQMTRIAQQAIQNPQVTSDVKKKFEERTATELLAQVAEAPQDARIRVFISSFYRVIGKSKEALEQLDEAVKLSPEKQQIWLEKALAHYQLGDMPAMLAAFKRAYELAPRYSDARSFYAGGALYAGDDALYQTLAEGEGHDRVYQNDFVLRAAYDTKKFDIVKQILAYRLERTDPKNNLQLRVSLAVANYESGDMPEAIRLLEEAIKDYPSFKTQGEEYIKTLKSGKQPS